MGRRGGRRKEGKTGGVGEGGGREGEMEGRKLEMRKGGEGEIVMPTYPESTKRT